MSYQKLIIESTGCNENEVFEIEMHMRDDILHSTLDWLSKSEFVQVAKEAYELYKYIQHITPFAVKQGKEWFQLTDCEIEKALNA